MVTFPSWRPHNDPELGAQIPSRVSWSLSGESCCIRSLCFKIRGFNLFFLSLTETLVKPTTSYFGISALWLNKQWFGERWASAQHQQHNKVFVFSLTIMLTWNYPAPFRFISLLGGATASWLITHFPRQRGRSALLLNQRTFPAFLVLYRHCFASPTVLSLNHLIYDLKFGSSRPSSPSLEIFS